jgi:hypothetical protein
MLPTDDFLLPSDYTKLIETGPDKFLATYPTGKHRAEIEQVKKTLQEEALNARRGMRKVDGKWLGARELQANEYNIMALRDLRAMEKLEKADKYREALIAFHKLEATGKMSVNYPKAIDLAGKIIDKYTAQLEQMVKNVPQKLRDMEKELTTLTPDEKKNALAARQQRKKDFALMIAEEKKAKAPFTSVNDVELASLQEAQRQLAGEKARLAALNKEAIATSAANYERILKLIGEQKYDEAAMRLDQFVKTDKAAGSDKDIKAKIDELKKLRENEQREKRQRELLERSQPKTPEAPKPTEGAPKKPE